MGGKKDSEAPDFARETRIVDFGQDLPPPQFAEKLTGGDPIPPEICVTFRTLKGGGPKSAVEMDKPIVILGRVEGVADVVVEDEAASRYHACVSHRDGKFILTDMGSTNGTFVNRRPMAEVLLGSGDEIRIGVTVLVFEIAARD